MNGRKKFRPFLLPIDQQHPFTLLEYTPVLLFNYAIWSKYSQGCCFTSLLGSYSQVVVLHYIEPHFVLMLFIYHYYLLFIHSVFIIHYNGHNYSSCFCFTTLPTLMLLNKNTLSFIFHYRRVERKNLICALFSC